MTDARKILRRARVLRLALGLLAVVAFVGGAAALWASRAGRLGVIDLSTILIVCIVIGIAAAGTALTYTPGAIPRSRRLDRWEKAQRNRSFNLVAQICIGPVLLGGWVQRAVEELAGGDTFWGVVHAVVVMVWVCSPPMILMGWSRPSREDRAYLDDELDRSFRAKALATGFWALLAAGGVVYGLALRSADTSPYLLPFSLWFGGAAACAHFVWLHHRAQPKGDGDDG